MRRLLWVALLLVFVLAFAGGEVVPPRAPEPVGPAVGCLGDAGQDGERLLEALRGGNLEQVDAILACGAAVASETPGYRWAMAHLLQFNQSRLAHLQGYKDWAGSTVLRFGEPRALALPEAWRELGYRIDSAVVSPSGQYVAARLRGGDGSAWVGWWRVGGGEMGLYSDAGYDLAWHGERFAYLTPGQIQIVTVGPGAERAVVPVPDQTDLRHTYWRSGELFYRHGSDEVVLAIADPGGSPEGVAYLPRLGLLDHFSINMTPLSWVQMRIPDWLSQPWHPGSGLLLTFADGTLFYPNPGGSPYSPYRMPGDARPVAQVWSPLGERFALLLESAEGRFVQVLRPTGDGGGPHPVHPAEAEQIGLSDDGATLFLAQGARLVARNQMAGAEEEWRLNGNVVELHHTHGAVHAVLPDRVVLIPYEP
ncbi:MAG: hypothetical protein ACOY93_22640 [Bacillota bacterium]